MPIANIANDIESKLAKGLFWAALDSVNSALSQVATHTERQPLIEWGLYACNRLKNLRDAASLVEQLTEYPSLSKQAFLEVAAYYTSIGNGPEAISQLRRAHDEFGASRVILSELALAYSDQGDNNKALKLFERIFANARKAKQVRESDLRAIGRLAELRSLDKREIAFLTKHFDSNRSLTMRRDIAFALAQAYQHSNVIEDEIAWLRSANHAARQIEKNSTLCWTPELAHLRASKIIELFSTPHPPWLAVEGHPQAIIFLLGMPRSGTTLLDQIISSHSAIGSTGESRGFSVELTRVLVQAQIVPPDPKSPIAAIESLPLLTSAHLEEITNNYLEYQQLYTNKPIILDKNLSLVDYVGVLANLLPTAEFIYLKRDVDDICVSLLQQNLRNAAFATLPEWALIESEIYQKKMLHWQTLYPNRIHTLQYEALAAEGAEYARPLIQSLGLDWEASMLQSASRNNVIKTPSATKVRNAITASQVGKKEKYADLLGSASKQRR